LDLQFFINIAKVQDMDMKTYVNIDFLGIDVGLVLVFYFQLSIEIG
jgi:hypothetical protein